MHINSDRLKESLTELELMHIEQCTQCATERKKLMALTVSAKHIELVQPPAAVWQQISSQIVTTPKANKKHKFTLWLGGVAASFFMMFVGFMSYQQVTIQQELTKLRLSNQLLEHELRALNQNREYSSDMLRQVLLTEQEMEDTSDKRELLDLLKRRQVAIKTMIEVEELEKVNGVIYL